MIDGTGAKPYRADVAIRNGFIHRIGDLSREKASIELDVKGLAVAPGFINLHSHVSPAGVATAVNMLTQGVTTEIANADGSGATDLAMQMQRFRAAGMALNVGAYIGFNVVWASVMGQEDRRPTTAEIERMRELLTANLKQGAWGVSAGLDYKPGYFARTEEAIAVMKAATPWRTNFPNHDRLTPESNYSSLAGMAETIEIAEKAGLMPVLTHIKVQGREQGSGGKATAMMSAASARGVETVADIYPYLAGQTGLGALFLPAWATSGGRAEMLKRFRDPAQRARIAKEMEQAIEARILTPANIDIPSKGRKFVDYMREMNAGAGETMIRILEQEHPPAIMKFGAEPDLVAMLRHPGTAVSCDCGAAEESPGMHPRYFGTFPRVLGHYVRETKALTIEDAVRKMTGLPASITGMVDRGFLAPGFVADIAVFDPATVLDHATFEKPTLPSVGVKHVLVNGRLALRDGKSTGEKAGAVLWRGADMPSRPMRVPQTRSVSAKAANLAVDVRQSGLTAQGAFRYFDAASQTEIRMTQPGLLQTSGQWASFTGLARVGSEEKAIQVILDGANPIRKTPRMRVLVEGREFSGPLPDLRIR